LKQEEKIVIDKERVAVKKRNEDFMIFTTDTLGIYEEVKMVHMYYRSMILKEIVDRRAAASGTAGAVVSVTMTAAASATT
jgi:hypothetical protein